MIDSGRGLIEPTPFEGPVLPPKKGRGHRGGPIKQPGLLKGKRKKLDDRDWNAPKAPAVYRYWRSRQAELSYRLRGKPGFPTHSRTGIPDGMRKAEAEALWREARLKAVNTFMNLVEKGQL